jgi:hypothetical protein
MSLPNRRVTFDYDPDPDLSWLEQWTTPETYRGNECRDEEGHFLTFEEYRKTVGNPEHHVTLMAICEEECPDCGAWKVVDSLHNIDFLADDDFRTGTFTAGNLDRLSGYQREIAEEIFGTAGRDAQVSELQ